MNKRTDYDHAYKNIFSEPLMVEHLITCLFDQEWVKDLDFSTLQRLNTEYTAEDYRTRESDIVWKVQWRGHWVYLLILIEFQSTVDPFMMVRMLSYISLMYQDIIKQDAQVRQLRELPPVLPIIIYSGDRKWNAPVNFSDYYPANLPKILKKFQPQLSSWLLDEGRYIIDESSVPGNLAATLVKLEQCDDQDEITALMRRLGERLKGPEFKSIRQAFVIYFERILRTKHMITESIVDERGELNMLSRNIDKMLEKATTKGLQQGEFSIIKRQLVKRFGPLTEEQEHKLMSKTSEELLELSERILSAKSINEIVS